MTKSKLTTKDLNASIVYTQQKKRYLVFFWVIFYIYVSNNLCALQLCTHVVSYFLSNNEGHWQSCEKKLLNLIFLLLTRHKKVIEQKKINVKLQ